jgi:hypothetical protein
MIVMLNGSFGIGKTTVAKLLRNSLPGSVMYDPEWAGSVLMRLPSLIKLEGSGAGRLHRVVSFTQRLFSGADGVAAG